MSLRECWACDGDRVFPVLRGAAFILGNIICSPVWVQVRFNDSLERQTLETQFQSRLWFIKTKGHVKLTEEGTLVEQAWAAGVSCWKCSPVEPYAQRGFSQQPRVTARVELASPGGWPELWRPWFLLGLGHVDLKSLCG